MADAQTIKAATSQTNYDKYIPASRLACQHREIWNLRCHSTIYNWQSKRSHSIASIENTLSNFIALISAWEAAT